MKSRTDWKSSDVSLDSIGPASRAPSTLEDDSGRLYKDCPARLDFALNNTDIEPFLQFAGLRTSDMAFDFELKWGGGDPDVEPPRITCPASFPLVAEAVGCLQDKGRRGAAGVARMRLAHTSRHLRDGSHELVTQILSGGTRGTAAAALIAGDNWNVTSVTASRANGTIVTPHTVFPPGVRVASRLISPRWGSIRVRLVLYTYAPRVRAVGLTTSRKTPPRKHTTFSFSSSSSSSSSGRTRVVFTATDIMGQTASCATMAVTFTTVASWQQGGRWVSRVTPSRPEFGMKDSARRRSRSRRCRAARGLPSGKLAFFFSMRPTR